MKFNHNSLETDKNHNICGEENIFRLQILVIGVRTFMGKRSAFFFFKEGRLIVV